MDLSSIKISLFSYCPALYVSRLIAKLLSVTYNDEFGSIVLLNIE